MHLATENIKNTTKELLQMLDAIKYEALFPQFFLADNLLMIFLITLTLGLGLWTFQKPFRHNKYLVLLFSFLLLGITKNCQKSYYGNFEDKLLILLIQGIFLGFFCYLLLLKDQNQSKSIRFENPILWTMTIFGILLTMENSEGLIIFLGLEIQAFTFYTLISLNERNISSAEGALKYFLLGALASGLFILGLGLIYGSTGQTNFTNLSEIGDNTNSLFALGALIIILGLLFKIGAAPFHFWLPDAYEGAPYYVLLFLLSFPKIGLMYLLFNINSLFANNNIILLSLILSAAIGSLEALEQTKTKRFVAYTIIFNNSFFLALILLTGKDAYYSLMESLVIYLLLSFLTVLIFSLLNTANTGENLTSLRDLFALKKNNIFLTLSLLLVFFSAAGIPPMIGFFQKYIILLNLIQNNFIFLALSLILLSIIPAFYYLRITKSIYFNSHSKNLLLLPININLSLFIALGTAFTLSVFY